MAKAPATSRFLAAALSAALCVTAVGACGSDDGGSSILSDVAPYAEGDSGSVSFVDWRTLQDEYDGAEVESDSEDAVSFFQRIGEQGDITSFYSGNPGLDVETVGFTPLDLDWEGQIFAEGSPVRILRFEESADLGAIGDALEGCGFEASDIDGGTQYTLPQPGSCVDDQIAAVTPSLSSIAILEDDRLGVAGSAPEAVEEALAFEDSGDEGGLGSAADDVSGQLDGVVAAELRYGEEACFAPTSSIATEEQLEQTQDELGDLGEPFEAILVGYTADGDTVEGLVSLDYAEDGDAGDALDARVQAFEEGVSFVSNQPVSDFLSLESSEADGDAIVFRVGSPEEGQPIPLFTAFQKNDLPFAGCPGSR